MNSNNDLLRREDVVKMIKDMADKYTISMFETVEEYRLVRIVALQCAMDVSCMTAYKEAGEE